jgi:hypothetical protein
MTDFNIYSSNKDYYDKICALDLKEALKQFAYLQDDETWVVNLKNFGIVLTFILAIISVFFSVKILFGKQKD